jgi:hypothetical protein
MTDKTNKPLKQNAGTTTGLLIGLMLGFLIGLGMLKQSQKSLRSDFFPYAVGLGVLFTSFCGYKIGALNDDQNYRDELLGILAVSTKEWTEGGNWIAESFWLEYDGKEHRILTTMVDGELVSIYNGSIIAYHGYTTSHMSVTKNHIEVKTDIILKLKDGYIM